MTTILHRTAATTARCKIVVFGLWILIALLASADLQAQIAVFPVQNLSFGTLRAGASEQVDPDDPMRRAEIEIVGTGNVVITFGLPTEMTNAAGNRLPLAFAKGDASVELRGSGKDRDFDPSKAKTIKIKDKEGGALIYLGGLAIPTATQPPGRYRATIVVQVVTPGT